MILPSQANRLITRVLISVLLLASLNSLLGFFAWLINEPINYRELIPVYTLLAFGLSLNHLRSASKIKQWPSISKEELVALSLSTVVLFIALAPIIIKPTAVNTTRVLMTGGDNTSHIWITNIVEDRSGYVQDLYSNREISLKAKLVPYPQGWHINMVLAKQTLESAMGSFQLERFLHLYHLFSAAGLALLAYFFLMTCFAVHKKLKINRLAVYSAILLIAGLLFSGPFFALYAIGFHTHIAALAMFFALLVLLMGLLEIPGSKQSLRFPLIMGALLTAGVPYVYLPLWPIALGALVVFSVHLLGIRSIKDTVREWKIITGMSVVAAFGFGQIIMQAPYFSSGSSALNESGFILEPNTLLLAVLLGILLIFAVYEYSNERVRLLSQVAGLSAIIALLPLTYQLLTTGSPRYFYYKMAYTFILLAAALLTLAISKLLSVVIASVGKNRAAIIGLAAFIIFSIASVAWAKSSTYFQLYVKQKPYGMSEELADAVITIVKKEPQNAIRTVAIGSCNREQDIKAMQLARALTVDANLSHQRIITTQVNYPIASKTFAAIEKYLGQEGKLIVVSTDKDLQNALTEYLGADRAAKIRFVDLDYGSTAKEQPLCPDALRVM